ncbi:hypothetical protein KKA53_01865 [Candidatus Dependentiae bacterium]|nr:hypothetical protein [Candidatus Dependentiae bacterium]
MEHTNAFELEIIKQTESKKVSILWVEIQSPTGNFVVGPEHHPLVSLLKHRGKLTYKEYNGNETSLDTYGGIFKVANNKATALLD